MGRITVALLALTLAGCATAARVAPASIDGREALPTMHTTETISTGLQHLPPQTLRNTYRLGKLDVFVGDFGGTDWPHVGAPRLGFGLCLDPTRPGFLAMYVPNGGCIEVKGYAVPAVAIEPR